MSSPGIARTVRDATFDVLRAHGLTTVWSNPGSTEIDFLVDLPPDLTFRLALHEASVVGLATGWAIGAGRPAFVNLHTTAGLGNAVGALATARVNRAPLVVVVGQQDRRHLAHEPFLAGHLDGLAGDYPVWSTTPARPQDVPGAVARAVHEARAGAGPALVVVPMDDWGAPAAEDVELPAPVALVEAAGVDDDALAPLIDALDGARAPALVAGAGAGTDVTWTGLVALAERLDAPVWQEAFTARAGFPQDHPRFAGHLPAGRAALRETLARHDVVLAVGAPAFRQYGYEPGPFVAPQTTVAVLTDVAEEARHSAAAVAVVAPLGPAVAALAAAVQFRPAVRSAERERAETLGMMPPARPLGPADVFRALAARLPADTVLVEETPSSREILQALVPARTPLGFVSAAMGGLGFALPAAAGLRLALPDRPVVAVVGDGSALFAPQALWSAATYGAGVLYLVLRNGGYAIMDRLADRAGGSAPWPGFASVDIGAIATGLGCEAERVGCGAGLVAALDAILPGLRSRRAPIVLEVDVSA